MEKAPGKLLEEVIARLTGDIESRAFPGPNLPSLRSLAQRYNCSRDTAARAVRSLHRIGALQAHSHSGKFYLPGSTPVKLPSLDVSPVYLRVAQQIRTEVLTGKLAPGGHLPPLLELSRAQRCSKPTLRKALDTLLAQGFLRLRGRSYYTLFNPHPRDRRSGVYFVSDAGVITSVPHQIQPLMTGIRQTLANLNWGGLRYHLIPRGITHHGNSSLPPEHEVAGYIQLLDKKPTAWAERLAPHSGLPVVLIDRIGRASIPVEGKVGRFKRLYHISPDNHHAGLAVARHLAGQGHRAVIIASQFPLEESWVRERVEGIQEIFSDGHLGKERVSRILTGSSVPDARDTQDIEDRIVDLRQNLLTLAGKASGWVAELARRNHEILDQVKRTTRILPAIIEGLARKEFTAWICINDELALAVRSVMIRGGLRPGQDRALVGFDNSLDSQQAGMTSYDFGFDEMGHTAVQCLAHPGSHPSGLNRPYRVRGFLDVRSSG